ncbi:hypothetical protein COLO4_16187 [Corchorus olitorius]|uniref:Protein transport protein SEC23 n=1 Tax=Corchorus olitorius TaxID=93759 RepID=A0A1R3JIP7_9ROSI|nr:hypothetical protein COLO4_16187 [Corchorus olitorius]
MGLASPVQIVFGEVNDREQKSKLASVPFRWPLASLRSAAPEIPKLPYAPLRCEICSAANNPLAAVDFTNKIWTSPFYLDLPDNRFPPIQTRQSSYPDQNNPANLPQSPPPPVFVFVLDPRARICYIGVEAGSSAWVVLDDLGSSDMSKVFRGSEEIPTAQVLELNGYNGFLLPLLDELQTDQSIVQMEQSASRCTGVALKVAAELLGAPLPASGARINALVGGPCTEGPGTVMLSDPLFSFCILLQ